MRGQEISGATRPVGAAATPGDEQPARGPWRRGGSSVSGWDISSVHRWPIFSSAGGTRGRPQAKEPDVRLRLMRRHVVRVVERRGSGIVWSWMGCGPLALLDRAAVMKAARRDWAPVLGGFFILVLPCQVRISSRSR
jgi:hypothetical protein